MSQSRPDGTGCGSCGAVPSEGLLICAGCHFIAYCSPACQRAHRKAHKKLCKTIGAATFEMVLDRAKAGDVHGQYCVGRWFARGESGVVKDLAQAVEWYRRAAEAGDPDAQSDLGRCYEMGDGVSKDAAQAVAWYTRAADAGNTSAQNDLGFCYANGTGVVVDQKRAVAWYHKAADAGQVNAQYNLFRCYSEGNGVSKDPFLAVAWLRRAAEAGNSQSMNSGAATPQAATVLIATRRRPYCGTSGLRRQATHSLRLASETAMPKATGSYAIP